MFTSVIKRMMPYLIVSVCCLVFSIIYEFFSHSVISFFMVGACLVPLLAGIIKLYVRKKSNTTLFRASWITFLVYFYMRGVIEIFGTTNSYLPVFLYAAIILFVLSFVFGEWKKSR